MHTIESFTNGKWTVGFELPVESGRRSFRRIKEFDNEQEAAEYVSFLNGGLTPPWWRPRA